jgi:hypothetical protein
MSVSKVHIKIASMLKKSKKPTGNKSIFFINLWSAKRKKCENK